MSTTPSTGRRGLVSASILNVTKSRLMAQLISEIWSGLRDAGIPEVMLYLPDHSASRCHWDDTTVIGGVRVALLADQERKIVRLLPVDSCTGIGVPSPKGVDPSGYKAMVQAKLNGQSPPPEPTEDPPAEAAAPPAREPAVAPEVQASTAKVENPPAGRWAGMASRSGSRSGVATSTG